MGQCQAWLDPGIQVMSPRPWLSCLSLSHVSALFPSAYISEKLFHRMRKMAPQSLWYNRLFSLESIDLTPRRECDWLCLDLSYPPLGPLLCLRKVEGGGSIQDWQGGRHNRSHCDWCFHRNHVVWNLGDKAKTVSCTFPPKVILGSNWKGNSNYYKNSSSKGL